VCIQLHNRNTVKSKFEKESAAADSSDDKRTNERTNDERTANVSFIIYLSNTCVVTSAVVPFRSWYNSDEPHPMRASQHTSSMYPSLSASFRASSKQTSTFSQTPSLSASSGVAGQTSRRHHLCRRRANRRQRSGRRCHTPLAISFFHCFVTATTIPGPRSNDETHEDITRMMRRG